MLKLNLNKKPSYRYWIAASLQSADLALAIVAK